MLDLTPEQQIIVRFCLENWDRIDYLRKKKLFDFKNGSITVHFKPTGQIQGVHYNYVDNEQELFSKKLSTL